MKMMYVNRKAYATFNNLDITVCFYIILIFFFLHIIPGQSWPWGSQIAD